MPEVAQHIGEQFPVGRPVVHHQDALAGLCGRGVAGMGAHAAAPQVARNLADESLWVDGLADVAVKPGRQDALPVAHHGIGGHRHHRYAEQPRLRSQPAQHFKAVDARQLEVAYHEVRPAGQHHLQGGLAVMRLVAGIAVGFEQVAGQVPVGHVVFNDEDTGLHGATSLSSSTEKRLPSPNSLSHTMRPFIMDASRCDR